MQKLSTTTFKQLKDEAEQGISQAGQYIITSDEFSSEKEELR
jgi:hypothetical protein